MNKEPRPPFPPQDLEQPGIEARMDPAPRYRAEDYKPAGKLKNKVALITGGDSGIGRAVAVLFAQEGADVALVFLEAEKVDAEQTKTEISELGKKAMLLPGDVTDADFCRQSIEAVIEQFGRIDILVNNAAYQKHQDDVADVSVEQWQRTFRTNIHAYYYLAKFALEHMKPGSAIINTGSITGLKGSPALLDYASTKGAIHAFTKSLAKNLNDRGIRVNCVAPGPVWTPLNPAERSDDDIKDFGSSTPIGRPAQPEEIAPAYVFFASSADSGYISGHVLPLLGGDTTAG